MGTHSAGHEPRSNSTLDALAAELGAMQVIASALSDIQDFDTRRRVLSWANERFTTAAAAVAAPVQPTERKAIDVDDTLEVDSLYEFFERRPQNDAALLALQAAAIDIDEPRAEIENDKRDLRGGGAAGMLIRGVARGLAALAAPWQTA
jgi:hypothetical protein